MKPWTWNDISMVPLPKGSAKLLVHLEEERLGLNIHTMSKSDNVSIIGGHFHFDMPKITHWMYLPESPIVEAK